MSGTKKRDVWFKQLKELATQKNIELSEETPFALNVGIILRFVKQDEFDDLLQRYKEARLRVGSKFYRPTPEDIKIYKAFMSNKISLKTAAEQMGVQKGTVQARFLRIAKLEYSK